ncbi:MAG: flagellar basal body L-ring protein FlgH [Spirochaetes bacterium]|nr:flagellar basal body L-ring protein FlgH [Spirochaetota bacterium]
MKSTIIILFSTLLFFGLLLGQSLWKDDGDIYSTDKKWKAGDSLKIIFNEASLVEYQLATSEAERVNAQGEGAKGAMISFLPSVGGSDNFQTSQKSSTKNKTRLQTSISVKITGILPNKNLKIAGSHSILVNNQMENITLTGEVNPRDIKKKKQVYSTDIIDASINYQSKIIKPEVIKPADYVETKSTNISVVSEKTQAIVTSSYEISEAKKREMILQYLNKIMTILFRK